MKNLSDESLVALYIEGKNEAFDELLFRYKKNVYAYFYSVVQNKEVAEDMFQDTFIKLIVYLKEGRYQENGRFVGFLFRICHNIIIDYYRQQQAQQTSLACDIDYDLFGRRNLDGDDMNGSIEEAMSYHDVLGDVRHILKFLPDNQRQIIYLRFYKNLPFKEIADMLGISINTALGRVRYALSNMRKLAEEHNISLAM
ncbi:MAG: sigma-70 family RNA polymerase sigma factor [Bacteroidales bacterium]|nr:sigma-70 family RNA polymerase sigma factor [Bacteroidales bacterium]